MLGQAAEKPTPRIASEFDALEATGLAARRKTNGSQEGMASETIGQRLARLRRERGMTQVELADRLGVAQPVVSDYERGELRLHGELIVKLTQLLGCSAEELLGLEKPRSTGPTNRRLLRRIEQIAQLPRRDQQALLRTIDRFLESFRPE